MVIVPSRKLEFGDNLHKGLHLEDVQTKKKTET